MESLQFSDLAVEDLMAAPVTLSGTVTVREAAMFLARAGIGAVPVVSSTKRYIGIVADVDIYRRLSEAIHGFHSPEEVRTGVPFMGDRLPDEVWQGFARVGWTQIRKLVRRGPPLRRADPLAPALEAMRREGLSALPVVETGEVVGILHADALTLRLVEFALRPGGFEPAHVRRNHLRSSAY